MNKHIIRIAAVFIWIGFVCSISFMEAWLKFKAPGVTLTTGLAIGRVVFGALNKVELLMVCLIFLSSWNSWNQALANVFLWIALFVLIIQSVVLLPQLSQRVDIYLRGVTPTPSHLHAIYVPLEVAKVVSLFIYGINQINNYGINITNSR